jgi:hypothetical protein
VVGPASETRTPPDGGNHPRGGNPLSNYNSPKDSGEAQLIKWLADWIASLTLN